MNILYISYDGILEPLGQSQVLTYLLKLAETHKITLISYEKSSDFQQKSQRLAMENQVKQAGIHWYPVSYHKTPSGLATAYDISVGILKAARLVHKHKITIVHARSYVASVIALVLKKLFKTRFIFDMRGFWADERIDGEIWDKDSNLYHIAKWFERNFLLSANSVVSLTWAAVDVMKTLPYLQHHQPNFTVITTCTDLTIFDYQRFPETLHWPEKETFTLGYVGTAGTWRLFDEVLSCFKYLKTLLPEAKLQILNKGEHDYIQKRLIDHDLDAASVTLCSADREQVVQAMSQMDAAIFFIKPVFSQIASAPTKLGEFLGCGVPCLSNTKVGDMANILESNHVGIAISDFTPDAMQRGVWQLLELCRAPDIRQRCKVTASKHFSLDQGVKSYDNLYQTI